MALPIETMDRELLAEKRQRRALNIQLLKADTPEKVVQEGFYEGYSKNTFFT
jgi:hypothetical protein